MNPKQTFYQTQAETIIQNLKKRRMEGYYCPTKEDAVKTAMSLTAAGTTVSFGGSVTLSETGILDALKSREDLRLIDRGMAKTPQEIKQAYRDSFSADTYFMSTNAITLDGHLVNVDGNGNRAAALVYGPKNVIIVAGMNKVTPDLESAVTRARSIAAPINAQRFSVQTGCMATGTCSDCLSPSSICASMVRTRICRPAGRIKVVLVGEELGF